MRRLLVAAALLLLPAGLSPVAVADPAPARGSGWQGDRHAQPSAYAWLGPERPADTYQITIIRGPSGRAQVLTELGTVSRDLGRMTPAAAVGFVVRHIDPDTYDTPPVVQVARLGDATVLYEPYGYRAATRVGALSRGSLVATFFTDVEYDTYVTIARHGHVLRDFDAGFEPPPKGALPEERGLDFGAAHQNVWATAWAFLERVTRVHLSHDWFRRPHRTYVLAADDS